MYSNKFVVYPGIEDFLLLMVILTIGTCSVPILSKSKFQFLMIFEMKTAIFFLTRKCSQPLDNFLKIEKK